MSPCPLKARDNFTFLARRDTIFLDETIFYPILFDVARCTIRRPRTARPGGKPAEARRRAERDDRSRTNPESGDEPRATVRGKRYRRRLAVNRDGWCDSSERR